MKKSVLLLVVLGLAASLLSACGSTPVPTEPPPTQTPWIVVVTATAGPGEAAAELPTQTPWIIVATPTAEPTKRAASTSGTEPPPSPEPTETEDETAVPVAATDTPSVEVIKYPPPALTDPPNDRPVSWGSTVVLEWASVGQLAKDEFYHVHLERRPVQDGQEWYGDYVYTKEASFLADQGFLAPFHYSAEHGKAMVYWWVRVVRKTGEDQAGKPIGTDIGAASEERTLVLDPKP